MQQFQVCKAPFIEISRRDRQWTQRISVLEKKFQNERSSNSTDRDICLKALVIMLSLILKRSSNKSKTSEIKSHVERKLNLWKNQDVEGLFNETRAIQKRLSQRQKP